MTRSSATPDFRMIGRKPTKKRNKKKIKKDKKKKSSITDSDEEYAQQNRVPITLKDFVPKGLLKDGSSEDDAFWGDGIAPCYMTTRVDICEEEKIEVDEITLHFWTSTCFFKRKKKEKEFTSCDDEKETNFYDEFNEEIPNPPTKENEKPEASHQEKTRRVPLILHNAPFKEMIKYDAIGDLKHIPARLSIYDAL
ncbi:LOW QUALITY PROTEIN: hypothetical protein V2J09_000907 [Rumex salicifolius]